MMDAPWHFSRPGVVRQVEKALGNETAIESSSPAQNTRSKFRLKVEKQEYANETETELGNDCPAQNTRSMSLLKVNLEDGQDPESSRIVKKDKFTSLRPNRARSHVTRFTGNSKPAVGKQGRKIPICLVVEEQLYEPPVTRSQTSNQKRQEGNFGYYGYNLRRFPWRLKRLQYIASKHSTMPKDAAGKKASKAKKNLWDNKITDPDYKCPGIKLEWGATRLILPYCTRSFLRRRSDSTPMRSVMQQEEAAKASMSINVESAHLSRLEPGKTYIVKRGANLSAQKQASLLQLAKNPGESSGQFLAQPSQSSRQEDRSIPGMAVAPHSADFVIAPKVTLEVSCEVIDALRQEKFKRENYGRHPVSSSPPKTNEDDLSHKKIGGKRKLPPRRKQTEGNENIAMSSPPTEKNSVPRKGPLEKKCDEWKLWACCGVLCLGDCECRKQVLGLKNNLLDELAERGSQLRSSLENNPGTSNCNQ